MKLSELAENILEYSKYGKIMSKPRNSVYIYEQISSERNDARIFKINRGSMFVSLEVPTEDIGSRNLSEDSILEAIKRQEHREYLVRRMGFEDDLEQNQDDEAQALLNDAKELLLKESIAPKDNVNHPSHYNQGKIECIEAIESATIGKSGIEAVCVANVIKYLWRYEEKGGIESVEKAMWYLHKLLEKLEVKE